MGVWQDTKLVTWATGGSLKPYDPVCVNTATVDLRLGKEVREPIAPPFPAWLRSVLWNLRNFPGFAGVVRQFAVDRNVPAERLWSEPIQFEEYRLRSGKSVLAHSAEWVSIPPSAFGLLGCKSTTGRLLLEHFHSGIFDPGFEGVATFEFKNDAPWDLVLRPGDRLVQLMLLDLVDLPRNPYGKLGRYQNQTGPTPHR